MVGKQTKPSPRSRATIETELAIHEQRRTEAAIELDGLNKRRTSMLVDLSEGADDRMDELDLKIRHAERIAPRADAAIATLQAELAAVLEAEEEVRREAIYAEGVAALAEHEKLASNYNAAAVALAEILTKMKLQKSLIQLANGAKLLHAQMLVPFEGMHEALAVANLVSLPGMLGEPAAWKPADTRGPYSGGGIYAAQ